MSGNALDFDFAAASLRRNPDSLAFSSSTPTPHSTPASGTADPRPGRFAFERSPPPPPPSPAPAVELLTLIRRRGEEYELVEALVEDELDVRAERFRDQRAVPLGKHEHRGRPAAAADGEKQPIHPPDEVPHRARHEEPYERERQVLRQRPHVPRVALSRAVHDGVGQRRRDRIRPRGAPRLEQQVRGPDEDAPQTRERRDPAHDVFERAPGRAALRGAFARVSNFVRLREERSRDVVERGDLRVERV
eukprot:31029-Pelagococcus_subviridis.AAC.2